MKKPEDADPLAYMKIVRGWPASAPRGGTPVQAPAAGADQLRASANESTRAAARAANRTAPSAAGVSMATVPPAARWIGVVGLTAALTAGVMWGWQRAAVAPVDATLMVQTTPPGAEVLIGGKAMGVSPLSVSLPAGEYELALTGADGQRREFAVTLTAGGSVVHHVELAMAAPALAPAADTGALRVETEPPGQTVLVDGADRGVTPLTVRSLVAGEHEVIVRGSDGDVRRVVVVRRGETMALVLAPAAAAAAPSTAAGWVAFDSPITLQLRENGQLVGTTDAARLMLPAGDHQIEMSNEALGFSTTRRVTIAADRTTTLQVAVPNGMLSINAVPWAEVFIGGERVGETPIANISRPIGTHDVVLRHPDLGERRATVTVSTRQTARLGVDMRKR